MPVPARRQYRADHSSIPTMLLACLIVAWNSLTAVLVIFRSHIPQQLHDKIVSTVESLVGHYYSCTTLIIDEHINGLSFNPMFQASEIYLDHNISNSPSVDRVKISMAPGQNDFCISNGEKFVETYRGMDLTWKIISPQIETRSTDDEIVKHRSIELRFRKKHWEKVRQEYLRHVLARSKELREANNVVKIYSFCGVWSSINLGHPSTFDTLAMDTTLKNELQADLDRFIGGREFYRRVGKAWKRSYLLYGPPGTGKSSLIAAIANYLKFHIYDVELTRLRSNSALRRVVLATPNQSILVIKDTDCSRKSQDREDGGHSQLAQSGLLDFIDGLWPNYVDEKIIIFTANHKDRLDLALLRPGRMDMHIHLSYCTPCGFKILAANYLGINDHSMFPEIEKLMTEVEVTPAEIAQELMKSNKAEVALRGLIRFLHKNLPKKKSSAVVWSSLY